MVIKLLLISLFIVGCGKTVSVKPLESQEKQRYVTEAGNYKPGILDASNKVIQFQGQKYKIVASSHQANTFINSQSSTSLINVEFIGGLDHKKLEIDLQALR